MNVRSWLLSHDDWSAVGGLGGLDEGLVMAERPRHVVLTRRGDLPDADWRRGHCFTEDWHLRWRRLGDAVRLVGMWPVPDRSGWGEPDAEQSLTGEDATPRSAVLWGRQEEGEEMWIELRIPNLMTPPTQHPSEHEPGAPGLIDDADHVRRVLHFVTYSANGAAAPALHRYVGIGYARSDADDTTFEPEPHPAA